MTEDEVPKSGSLGKCIWKKSTSIVKKLGMGLLLLLGITLLVIALWTLFQALSQITLPMISNVWSGIYSGLAFVKGSILSFLYWIPWPVYLIVIAVIVILLYSLVWCIQRKFRGEENFSNSPGSNPGLYTFCATIIIGLIIGVTLVLISEFMLGVIIAIMMFLLGAFAAVLIDAYMMVRDRFGEDQPAVEEKSPEEKPKEPEESKLECEKVL